MNRDFSMLLFFFLSLRFFFSSRWIQGFFSSLGSFRVSFPAMLIIPFPLLCFVFLCRSFSCRRTTQVIT